MAKKHCKITKKIKHSRPTKISRETKKKIQKLIKSGILKKFIQQHNSQIKNKKARELSLRIYINNILHSFRQLRYWKEFQDPARDYLKTLQKDYGAALQNKDTTSDTIKLKIGIVEKYIEKFRHKKKQELAKDLLFLDLYEFLSSFTNRNKIIADLCIFFGLSNVICWEGEVNNKNLQYYPTGCRYRQKREVYDYTICKNIKPPEEKILRLVKRETYSKKEKHKECDYFSTEFKECSLDKPCPRALRNVKQRLKRLRKLFKQGLKDDRDNSYIIHPLSSKEYKTFEQYRIQGLDEAIKIPNLYPSQKETIGALLKNKKSLRKYIRSSYIKSCINDFLKQRYNELDGFNFSEIPPILNDLRISRNKHVQIIKSLSEDADFLMAFKYPIVKQPLEN